MLIDLHFYGDDEQQCLDVQVIPAIQSGHRTIIVKEAEEQERILNQMKEMKENTVLTVDQLVEMVKEL